MQPYIKNYTDSFTVNLKTITISRKWAQGQRVLICYMQNKKDGIKSSTQNVQLLNDHLEMRLSTDNAGNCSASQFLQDKMQPQDSNLSDAHPKRRTNYTVVARQPLTHSSTPKMTPGCLATNICILLPQNRSLSKRRICRSAAIYKMAKGGGRRGRQKWFMASTLRRMRVSC